MHVLLTVNSAWNVWNFRLPVVKALLDDGHTLTVLAPPDESVARLWALGCRVVQLRMDVKGLNPIRDLGLLLAFVRIFRREKPDIILGYTIKNNIFGAIAAKMLGIAFLPNVSGLGTAFLSGGALQWIAQLLYRRSFSGLPVVFFQNTEDRDLFENYKLITSTQARVLPGSGIDLKRFVPVERRPAEQGSVFLMIARLLRDKGVREYAEAARRVKTTNPEACFQLLGAVDANNRSAIDAETVQEWVSEGIIEYLGTTDDVRPFIAVADCVVLPSYREGTPRTLIEAAAMAKPLIATDVPGCRSVVLDGLSGMLCEARDAKSLADAIVRFLNLSTDARQQMGQAARAHMERDYDEVHVVAAYRDAIDELTCRNL